MGDLGAVVLVGGGHAHLEVLKRWAESRPAGVTALTLVSPGGRQVYSGMLPGHLAGLYREEDITIDLVPLVRAAGGEWVDGLARSLHPGRRELELEGGRFLGYDRVSFNIGSKAAGQERLADASGVLKPVVRAPSIRERLRRLRPEPGSESQASVTVVGAGAAGFELALAARGFLGDRAVIRLLDASPSVLPGAAPGLRRRAEQALRARQVDFEGGVRVRDVTSSSVELEDGRRLPSGLTIWSTGASGWPVFESSGLPVDRRGFLLVDANLRSLGDPRVFAAGDCATLARHPDLPKAGVYAVRQAPFLAAALAGRENERLPGYEPQKGFLSILATGDRRALLSWKGVCFSGRSAWWLKNWIDRRFVGRYRAGATAESGLESAP